MGALVTKYGFFSYENATKKVSTSKVFTISVQGDRILIYSKNSRLFLKLSDIVTINGTARPATILLCYAEILDSIHLSNLVGPTSLTAPVVTGGTDEGDLLTTTDGTWTGSPTFEYQWFRNGVAISGATSNTYTLVLADSEKNIYARVKATDGGFTYANSNTIVAGDYAPVVSVLPAISGFTTEGSTLTTTNGTWVGTSISYAYQWYRGINPISGATNNTYVLVLADSEEDITCEVTATNTAGSTSDYSNIITAGDYSPVNTVAPNVTGATGLGDVLTSTTGTWTGTSISYSYQWQRGGVDIIGETASTHTIVALDQGANVTCIVTATNTAGATQQVSNTIAVPSSGVAPTNSVAPVASGTAIVGQTLTTTNGTWSGTPGTFTYSYQWQRNGSNIGGATSSTYVLVGADSGQPIRCVVTASNGVSPNGTANSNALTIYRTLLDEVTNANYAYSLDLLRGAHYGSPTVRVRRSGDNAEFDFGVTTSGVLDTASLVAFVIAGGGTQEGFITKEYNQTGTTLDRAQTSASRQARIVNSGVLVTKNGKACMDYYSATIRYDITGTSTFIPLHDGTACFVSRVGSITTASDILIDTHNGSATGVGVDISAVATSALRIQIGNGSSAVCSYTTPNNTYTSGDQVIFGVCIDADNATAADRAKMFFNGGSAIGSNSATAAPSTGIHTAMRAQNAPSSGECQELIFWFVDMASSQTAIRDNQRARYGTY
jgi:hypothetical protein